MVRNFGQPFDLRGGLQRGFGDVCCCSKISPSGWFGKANGTRHNVLMIDELGFCGSVFREELLKIVVDALLFGTFIAAFAMRI